ncbi:hypothetical protein BVG79_00808 [Ketogulonicigenium robustum]|uniref:Integral membrane protein n=1 Tax=Ketogulonicigenium robustum TaxID=92947 RepID=A0A1W6NYI6_9RHOB|nr:periplasmic heavy metal sensor [Ketogulonicigenium robustum]ARO14160.1 hypothetical protein BVG79_00808 [Ketogulonicigenium robustum]
MAADTIAKGRRLRWVLFGSLTLNVLLGGVGVGAALGLLQRQHAGGPPPMMQMMSVGPLSRALSDEDRAAVMDQLRSSADGHVSGWRNMRRDSAEMLQALRAPTFDPTVFEVIFARQNESDIVLQGALQHALIGRLTAMSQADRTAFADRLQEAFDRPPRPAGPPRGPDRR